MNVSINRPYRASLYIIDNSDGSIACYPRGIVYLVSIKRGDSLRWYVVVDPAAIESSRVSASLIKLAALVNADHDSYKFMFCNGWSASNVKGGCNASLDMEGR